MALMTIIIENGWTDEAFMKQKTVAPFLVKESDGKYLRLSDLGQAEAGSDADAIVVTDGSGTYGENRMVFHAETRKGSRRKSRLPSGEAICPRAPTRRRRDPSASAGDPSGP